MYKLKIPFNDSEIGKLKVGDEVLISGIVFTARDNAHTYLLENDFLPLINSMIYHCGPIVKEGNVIAAGPTTSARFNKYTPALVDKYQIKGIIGKGGMSDTVVKALKGKAVYFSAIGGTAVLYADKIKIKGVYKEELGMTEAIWELEIKDFPVIVAIDSQGHSLYNEVYNHSRTQLGTLINKK